MAHSFAAGVSAAPGDDLRRPAPFAPPPPCLRLHPASAPAPATPPQIAAGAPAAPPVANAPAVATLPGGGLLENALPALPGERPDSALQAIVDAAIDHDNGTSGVLVRQLSTGATAA